MIKSTDAMETQLGFKEIAHNIRSRKWMLSALATAMALATLAPLAILAS
jgi:hypothetical protein